MDVLYPLWLVEHLVFALAVVLVISIWTREGADGVLSRCVRLLRTLPPVEMLIQYVLESEVRTFTSQLASTPGSGGQVKVPLPKQGVPHADLLTEMERIKSCDADPASGKMFALVYTGADDTFRLQTKAYDMFCEQTGLDPDHESLVRAFHHAFMHENALNPIMFPSLRRFENEIVSMTASMLHGDSHVVGSLTSGGTESILMAMKAYRDRARKLFPHIKNPEMVAPITIHPAHEKAAAYFGFTIIHVPVNRDFVPCLKDYEQAITPNTITLLSSAPQYCHGVVDPIEALSSLAVKHELPLHVDACFGGFMLPWVEKLGYSIPQFDFRLPGVTSISADIHKYGYGTKGASVVLYRNEAYRRHQIFAYSQWPGGLFGSPSMSGTRPGGNIAAAWATLRALGEEGYMEMAAKLMVITKKMIDGVNLIDGLCVLGTPHMTSFAIGSCDPDVSILGVADILEEQGWKPERQQYPDSLHCSITPNHLRPGLAEELIEAIREAVNKHKAKEHASNGSAAMYGMVARIPDKSIIDDFIVEFFSEVYK